MDTLITFKWKIKFTRQISTNDRSLFITLCLSVIVLGIFSSIISKYFEKVVAFLGFGFKIKNKLHLYALFINDIKQLSQIRRYAAENYCKSFGKSLQ